MKKIIVFGASNSKSSINKQFAAYAADQLKSLEIELLDLNHYEMPIYSIDRERESGFPKEAVEFKQKIRDCDGVLISFAEHNSAYTSAFKNIYDWISRIEQDVWLSKPMLLLSTAPGGGGGKHVLEIAYNRFSRANENIIGTFSLPLFKENFDPIEGIKNPELHEKLQGLINDFERKVNS